MFRLEHNTSGPLKKTPSIVVFADYGRGLGPSRTTTDTHLILRTTISQGRINAASRQARNRHTGTEPRERPRGVEQTPTYSPKPLKDPPQPSRDRTRPSDSPISSSMWYCNHVCSQYRTRISGLGNGRDSSDDQARLVGLTAFTLSSHSYVIYSTIYSFDHTSQLRNQERPTYERTTSPENYCFRCSSLQCPGNALLSRVDVIPPTEFT